MSVKYKPFVMSSTHSYIKDNGDLVVITQKGHVLPARFSNEQWTDALGNPIENVSGYINDAALRGAVEKALDP